MLISDTSEGPILYGHRGGCRSWPESSMAAFRGALEAGADALEIDVHVTDDGHVMVAHDADGTRMAAVDRRIRETTLELVQAWDISRGFDGDTDGPVRMPTLDQVLTELPEARLNIDIKQASPDAVQPVLEVIHRHAAASRVLLTSFRHATLSRIRRLGYGGQTGSSQREAMAALFVPQPLRRVVWPGGQRLQIPPSYRGLDLGTSRFIDHFRSQGLRVDFWVINEPDEVRRLLDAGADGIITDVPEVIANVFADHPRTEGWRSRHFS